ncbi:MAG: hypothetical protein NZ556_07505 [Fimbriimonadales bacterium]|nr:hypothetical protein [Fimbriimonadales bacterium]
MPRGVWLGRLAQAACGLDSRVQARARTRLSVLRLHGLEARATQGVAWASRPSSVWLGQPCPSQNARTRLSVLRLHGLGARATQGRRRDADATRTCR